MHDQILMSVTCPSGSKLLF